MQWVKFGGVWKCAQVEHATYHDMASLYFTETGCRWKPVMEAAEYEVYRTWMLVHPKFLENMEKSTAYRNAVAAAEAGSFVGQGLNKPGVLLRVGDRVILLGHTTPDGQDSGCCTTDLLNEDDIVSEYAVLIDLDTFE